MPGRGFVFTGVVEHPSVRKLPTDLSLLPSLAAVLGLPADKTTYPHPTPATAGHVKLCQHLGTASFAGWQRDAVAATIIRRWGGLLPVPLDPFWPDSIRREQLRRKCRSLRRCDSESGQALDPRIEIEPRSKLIQPR